MSWISLRVMNESSCLMTFILVWSSVHYLSFLSTLMQTLLMSLFNAAWWWVFNRFFKIMLVKSENDQVNEIMMLMMITWCYARLFIKFNWNISLLLQEIWSSKMNANSVKMMKVNEATLLKNMRILLSKDKIMMSREIISWSWCSKSTFMTLMTAIAWIRDAEVLRMRRNWNSLWRLNVIFEELLFKSMIFFWSYELSSLQ